MRLRAQASRSPSAPSAAATLPGGDGDGDAPEGCSAPLPQHASEGAGLDPSRACLNREFVARFHKRWNHYPAYVSETGYSSLYAIKAARGWPTSPTTTASSPPSPWTKI